MPSQTRDEQNASRSEPTRFTRRHDIAAVVLLAMHAVLSWAARAPAILTRQDDARYIGLARALRAGEYRDVIWVGAPTHHMYPLGYPTVLAVWMSLGGERFDWLVLSQILISTVTIGLLYLAARKVFTPSVVFGALLLTAVNPSLVGWAGQIDSELALAGCTMVIVWASIALQPGRAQWAIMLLFATLSPFMRTAGVVAPPALVAYLLLQRRIREALVAALISGAFVGGLLWWTFHGPPSVAGSSYLSDLYFNVPTTNGHSNNSALVWELLARVKRSAIFYPTIGIPWGLPAPTISGTIIDNVLTTIVLGVVIVAGMLRAYRVLPMAVLLMVSTAGLLLLWPYLAERFVVPILSLVILMVLVGTADLAARVGGSARTLGLAVAIAAIGLTAVVRTARLVRTSTSCGHGQRVPSTKCITADQASFFAASEFIRQSLPANAHILASKSEPLAVYSGRLTVPFQPMVGFDSAAFWSTLQRDSAEYVLLGRLHWSEPIRLQQRLAARCADLSLVAKFPPRTFLFQITPQRSRRDTIVPSTHTAQPPTAACAALTEYAVSRDST